jgi:hypothetical protein
MEDEENPGFTPVLSEPLNRGEDFFESQLREIDTAINYHPILKENISEKDLIPIHSSPPTTPTEPLPKYDSHAVLGDITNSNPKMPSAKKSWKKLARAKVHYDSPILEPMQSKRTSSFMEENNSQGKSVKKQCGVSHEQLTAAAAVQSRREQ